MKALKEITKWDEDYIVPNHTYILNDSGNLIAYVIKGTGEYVEFKKPIKAFSKSRRKFEEVKLPNLGPF